MIIPTEDPRRGFLCFLMSFRGLPNSGSIVACLILLSSALGCGSSDGTVPVQGRVIYREQALANGSVTFFPVTGRPVNVPLSAEGTYTANLAPGEYTVTVNYTEPLPPGYKEGAPLPKPKITLPPEYNTRAKSKLAAQVADDHSEPINFDLQ